MGRAKPGKPRRRSPEERIEARENRSSAALLRRVISEVEMEKKKSSPDDDTENPNKTPRSRFRHPASRN